MPDFALCNNKSCPSKADCYRYMAEPDPNWQSYGEFEYKDGCDYFIPFKK